MTTILTQTVSAGPLFDWFAQDKNNRAKLRSAGYSDGRITNWKSRGIPRAEIGNIAPFMGMTYEEYVHAADAWQVRIKKLRRVAVVAALWIAVTVLIQLNITHPAYAELSSYSAHPEYTLSRIRKLLQCVILWIRSLFPQYSDLAIA